MARLQDNLAGATTQGELGAKMAYNQVDQLTNENSKLRELVLDQKEELLNLYRRLYTGQDRPSY